MDPFLNPKVDNEYPGLVPSEEEYTEGDPTLDISIHIPVEIAG